MEIKDIDKLAELARIEINQEEKLVLMKDLNSILGYVEQISTLNIDSLEKEENVIKNVFREDKNPHEGGVYSKRLLEEAPTKEGDFIKVKQIL